MIMYTEKNLFLSKVTKELDFEKNRKTEKYKLKEKKKIEMLKD